MLGMEHLAGSRKKPEICFSEGRRIINEFVLFQAYMICAMEETKAGEESRVGETTGLFQVEWPEEPPGGCRRAKRNTEQAIDIYGRTFQTREQKMQGLLKQKHV